jgi:hypothetical protein
MPICNENHTKPVSTKYSALLIVTADGTYIYRLNLKENLNSDRSILFNTISIIIGLVSSLLIA